MFPVMTANAGRHIVGFELSPVCQYCPHSAYVFVGERHGCDIRVPPGKQIGQPYIRVLGFALRCQDGGARSVDQQRAQIRIAALLIPRRVDLPPLECCRGTNPTSRTCRPCQSARLWCAAMTGRFCSCSASATSRTRLIRSAAESWALR